MSCLARSLFKVGLLVAITDLNQGDYFNLGDENITTRVGQTKRHDRGMAILDLAGGI